MLKYVDTLVGFQEVPDEICLNINISNCPNNCKGCHSSYLKYDVGTPLTIEVLNDLLIKNYGVTCVCLMGGDANPEEINALAVHMKLCSTFRYPKIAWYSGKQELDPSISLHFFDYIKLGPYNEELGPLNSKNTNQKMYKIDHSGEKPVMIDITSKFWK